MKTINNRYPKQEMSTALSLIVSLGAYCPRVKLPDEKIMAVSAAKAKRRTRPLIGRGKYGLSLQSHFDLKLMKEKQARINK